MIPYHTILCVLMCLHTVSKILIFTTIPKDEGCHDLCLSKEFLSHIHSHIHGHSHGHSHFDLSCS